MNPFLNMTKKNTFALIIYRRIESLHFLKTYYQPLFSDNSSDKWVFNFFMIGHDRLSIYKSATFHSYKSHKSVIRAGAFIREKTIGDFKTAKKF